MTLDFTNVDNFALRYITMEYCYSHAFIMTKMIIIESRRYEAPHDELWPVAVYDELDDARHHHIHTISPIDYLAVADVTRAD